MSTIVHLYSHSGQSWNSERNRCNRCGATLNLLGLSPRWIETGIALPDDYVYCTVASDNVCCQCGSIADVAFAPNPFSADVYGNDTNVWMCELCRANATDDI